MYTCTLGLIHSFMHATTNRPTETDTLLGDDLHKHTHAHAKMLRFVFVDQVHKVHQVDFTLLANLLEGYRGAVCA